MPYKNGNMKDTIGKFRTQSLFYEYAYGTKSKYPIFFTVKDYDYTAPDGVTYPSLFKLYMSYDHIPGYEFDFATEILDGWEHFQLLLDNKLFAPLFKKAREQKEIQLQANAIKKLIQSDRNDAARYIAGKEWKSLRGRPSNEEVARERKIQAGVKDALADDMARIGLVAVK